MRPLIKYTGGKSRELAKFIEYIPEKVTGRYIEPFFGGGALFFDRYTEHKESLLNDNFIALMNFYECVKAHNDLFYDQMISIDNMIKAFREFCVDYLSVLQSIYKDYCAEQYVTSSIKGAVRKAIENVESYNNQFWIIEGMTDLIEKKFGRMKKLGIQYNDTRLVDSMIAAFIGSYYLVMRNIYNDMQNDYYYRAEYRAANFLFIREFCFGGGFRYNDKGEFNLPYGGISYNNKDFTAKIESIWNCRVFNNAQLFNMDWEKFLDSIDLQEDDFIFLDPPYPTAMDNYNGGRFTDLDHRRLAEYLQGLSCKWLLVIEDCPLVDELYRNTGLLIREYDYNYSVNIKNRFDNRSKHLVIKNKI